MTQAEARSPAIKKVQNQQWKFALLSYMRFWSPKKTSDPSGPSLATIDPGEILVRNGDKVEAVEGPLKAMSKQWRTTSSWRSATRAS